MKVVFLPVALSLFCIIACKSEKEPQQTELACSVNTFGAPVTAVSDKGAVQGTLYLGFKNGNILRKEGDSQTLYSTGKNQLIYDIYRLSGDSLLAGVRDNGLLLLDLKNNERFPFPIPHKGNSYSVYCIARDSTTGTLFLGTSNGLFKIEPKLRRGSVPEEISLSDGDSSGKITAVYKIHIINNILYAATDRGLFAGQAGSLKKLSGERINDIVEAERTENKGLSGSKEQEHLLYVISEGAVTAYRFKADGSLADQPEVVEKGRYLSYGKRCGPLDTTEWMLTNNSLIYKNHGNSYEYLLRNGISTKGKNICLVEKNFIYIAGNEELMAFPVHQNIGGERNNVLAMSPPAGGKTWLITSDLRLHIFDFRNITGVWKGNNPSTGNLGRIKGIDDEKLGENIVGMVHTGDNSLFVCTRSTLYRIRGNRAGVAARISDYEKGNEFTSIYYPGTGDILFVGTRQYLAKVSIKESKGLNPVLFEETEEGGKGDMYIADITGETDRVVAATLNRGVYEKSAGSAEFKKIWNSEKYGSTYETVFCGKDDLLLLSSEGLFFNNSDTLSFKDINNIKSISGNIAMAENNFNGCYMLGYNGLKYLNTGSLKDYRNGTAADFHPDALFQDIAFEKRRMASENDLLLAGTTAGMFLYKIGSGELIPVIITPEKDYLLLKLSGGVLLLLFIFAGFFIAVKKSYFKWMQQGGEDRAEQIKRQKELVSSLEAKFNNIEPKLRTELQRSHFRELHNRFEKERKMVKHGKRRPIEIFNGINNELNRMSDTMDLWIKTINELNPYILDLARIVEGNITNMDSKIKSEIKGVCKEIALKFPGLNDDILKVPKEDINKIALLLASVKPSRQNLYESNTLSKFRFTLFEKLEELSRTDVFRNDEYIILQILYEKLLITSRSTNEGESKKTGRSDKEHRTGH